MQATGCDGRPIFSGGLNDEDPVDVTLPHRLDLEHLHDAPPLAFGVVELIARLPVPRRGGERADRPASPPSSSRSANRNATRESFPRPPAIDVGSPDWPAGSVIDDAEKFDVLVVEPVDPTRVRPRAP